jgi:hypothetical protein
MVCLSGDVILLIGSSKASWEKAAANAVEQASKSLHNLRVGRKGRHPPARSRAKISLLAARPACTARHHLDDGR